MGLRIYATSNEKTYNVNKQQNPFIKDEDWNEIIAELLGPEYDYWNVWNESNNLSNEGIHFLYVQLTLVEEAKKNTVDKHLYQCVMKFLKDACENGCYLKSF